jgi:hypothetical protein
MVQPEIRQIRSLHLEPPAMPDDPRDCEVAFEAFVGPKDGEGDEAFYFLVVTPQRLSRAGEARWGRGTLVLPAFDWQTVAACLAQILARCTRPTWEQVVSELSKDLVWEADRRDESDA